MFFCLRFRLHIHGFCVTGRSMRITGHRIAFIPANPAFIDVRSLGCLSSDRFY